MIFAVVDKVQWWLREASLPQREQPRNASQDSLKLLLDSQYKCLTPENIIQVILYALFR